MNRIFVELPQVQPMVVGIWAGESKPLLSEYLEPLIDELETLLTDGIRINSHHIGIKIGQIICDTPARAFIKGTILLILAILHYFINNVCIIMNSSFFLFIGTVMFNHKHGCQKCLVVGEYSRQFHRVSFPDLNCSRRTNSSFRNRMQPIHHKEESVFERINIDMIKSFPTSDPLHLLELGVMRRCLYRWVFGAKSYNNKWPKSLKDMASRLLTQCQNEKPSDIHRAIRTLDCLKHWKGLEYRTMLLYVASVILKQVLPVREYNHFLMLFVAVRICSSEAYKNKLEFAAKLYRLYVQQYELIYGRHMIGSNIHNLIHIIDDMRSCGVGNLIDISTYKFENRLRLLGMDIKHTNRPLEQVVCRTVERNSLPHSKISFDSTLFEPKVSHESKNNPGVYKKIEFAPNVILSSRKRGDSFFMTESKEVVKFEYVSKDEFGFKIYGLKIKENWPFFTTPINSTKLDIYASNCEFENDLELYEIESIQAKMICLSCEKQFVFMPLLHTIKT